MTTGEEPAELQDEPLKQQGDALLEHRGSEQRGAKIERDADDEEEDESA